MRELIEFIGGKPAVVEVGSIFKPETITRVAMTQITRQINGQLNVVD